MKESDILWQSIAEAATEPVFIITMHGDIISANQATAKRFDLDPDALPGINVVELISPTVAEQGRKAIDDAINTKRATHFEHNDGHSYFIYTVYPIWNANNDVNKLVIFSTDLSEHKQAEESLRKSKEYYRSIVQRQTEMICRFKPDFTLTFVNEAYCRYFAKSEHELLGQSFFTLIPKEFWESVRQHFATFTPKRSVQIQQHPVVTPSGSQRWQQWTNRAFFNENGTLIEFQSGGIDITERKRAEERTQQLLQQNRSLTQRLFKTQEEERRHLARELHDEFGQWLTAIQLNAQNITNMIDEQSPEVAACTESIVTSAAHIQKEIRDMIRNLRPTSLDELGLADSLRELVSQWQERNQDINCVLLLEDELENLGETLTITIYRLVQEGLTNVTRHAQASHVSVKLKRRRDGAKNKDSINLVIEDDGKGFDIGEVKTGFGLSGMRERVLAAGGNFYVNESKKKGVRLEAQLFVDSIE